MKSTLLILRRIARGGSPIFAVLLTISTQALVVILNVATGVVTARVLGAEGRGAFSAATIWPQFLTGIAGLGLPAAIVYYARAFPEKRREIAGAAYVITSVAAAAATVVGIVVAPLLMADVEPSTVWLAKFCILWTFISLYTVAMRQIALADGSYDVFSTSSYIPPSLYLFFLVITWAVFGLTSLSAAICLMLSGPVSLAWTYILLRRRLIARFQGCGQWIKLLIGYAARLAPSEVAGSLLGYIDRLLLIPFLSPADLGLYVVAYSLSRIVFVLQMTVTSVLYPSMVGRQPSEAKTLHDIAFRLIIVAATGVAVITFLFAPISLRLVYGAEFSGAVILLRILMVEAAIGCLAQVTVNLYLSLKRPGAVSWIQLTCLVFTVVGLLLLVPRFGAVGAATVLMLAAFLRLGLLLGGLAIFFRMRLPALILTASDIFYIRSKF